MSTRINAYAVANPDYRNPGAEVRPSSERRKGYPIYKKKPKPPKKRFNVRRLTAKELFEYLNLWDIEPSIKDTYVRSFKSYLERKVEDVALDELQRTMKKPDFIKFFKYLKDKKPKENQDSEDSSDAESIQGYTAASRRKLHQKKLPAKKNSILDEFKVISPKPFKKSTGQVEEANEPTCEDFIIVQHFFNGVVDRLTNRVTKQNLLLYLFDNTKFCKAYEISQTTVEHRLTNYPTATEDELTLEEFINFVLYPKHIIQHRQTHGYSRTPSENDTNFDGQSTVSQELWGKLKQIFKQLDIQGNGQVAPIRFVQAIRAQPDATSFLFSMVFKVGSIEKSITLEKFLYEFEIDQTLKQQVGITWDDFVKHLTHYRPYNIPHKDVILRSRQISGAERDLSKLYKYEYLHLSSQFYHLLERLFERCDLKFQHYVQLRLLLTQLRCNDDFMKYASSAVRSQPTNVLLVETVDQTLNRMEVEAEPYLDFDEVVDFFSVRGRPLSLDNALKGKHEPIKELSKEKEPDKVEPKGFGAVHKIGCQEFYITIPENSRLTEDPNDGRKTLRQKWLEKELHKVKKEEDKALGYQFKAKKVPWYVSEPLLDKINREKQENRLRIRDETKRQLMSNTRPLFEFEKREMASKKADWSEPTYGWEDFRFRARPVPKTSSELMYQQLLDQKKEQSMRNIEKRINELTEMSDMPVGVKHMLERAEEREMLKSMSPYHKHGCTSSEGVSFEHVRARGMPDFERLHKDFEDEMAAKKRQFTPTVPYDLNITNTNMKPLEHFELNGTNQYERKRNRIGEIDRRLQRIMATQPNQVYATRKHEDLVEMRRKQKYDKYMKAERETNELQSMKRERQQLLPKGMDRTNLAIDAQKILDRQLQESVEWKREYHKNMDNRYEHDKRRMVDRVRKRPLLMYQVKNGVELYSDEDGDGSSSYESDTDTSPMRGHST